MVAVATVRDRRGRGLMRRLLGSALTDMFQEGMEFCFLMPADRRLYEPFGFAYVYDQPHLALTPEAERRLRRCVADDRTLPAAAAYMEEWLQNRREVRTVRDEAYVRRLAAELESENGCLELLLEPEKDGNAGFLAGRIAGVRGIQGRKQRFLLCGEENCEEAKPAAPAIMARIVCLERFLKAVRLKEESRLPGLAVRLTVTDPVCAGNQGTFLWELDTRDLADYADSRRRRSGKRAGDPPAGSPNRSADRVAVRLWRGAGRGTVDPGDPRAAGRISGRRGITGIPAGRRKGEVGMTETEKLKQWIEESGNVVFFGGAGVSTESGIPDFRSQDGLYSQQYQVSAGDDH